MISADAMGSLSALFALLRINNAKNLLINLTQAMKYKPILFITFAAITLLFAACKNKDIDIETFRVRDNVTPTATGVTIRGSYSFSGNVNGMKVNIGLDKELGDAEVYNIELDEGTDFFFTVDGVLIPDTTYYYRYSVDLGRGFHPLQEIDSFATLATASTPEPLEVEIIEIQSTDIDTMPFRVQCKVVSHDGAEVTERGICYNTFGHPDVRAGDAMIKDSLVGTGTYFIYMRNLAYGKYFVRAYAWTAEDEYVDSRMDDTIKMPAPQGTTVEIGVAANPEEGGWVDGGGTYAESSVVELKAIPNVGYSFDHWQDGNRDNPRTITVTVDTTYTAYFTPVNTVATPTFTPDAGTYNDTQDVTISCTTNGTTIYYTMDGSEPSTSSTEYESEITVSETTTLKAMAVKEGMLNSAVATATYNIVPLYNVTIDEDIEHGMVTASETTAAEGTPVTLTADPTSHYHFGEWHVTSMLGDDVTVTDNTFVMPAANVRVSASFEPDTLMIRVYAEPSNGGTVSIISEGINYGNCQSFAYGTTIQLNATANDGYHFDRWSDDGSQTHSVPVMDSIEYVAYFYENGQTADQTFSVGTVSFKMKYVDGGTYWMGAQSINVGGQNYDGDAEDSESPVHSVTISTFYMGETEVTQELWQAVMGSNPSNFSGTNLPVEQVSWNDCQEFIHKLNQLKNSNFRLPTEAEWEYAARGGNQSHGYKYAGSNTIGNVAWYTGNSNSQTHPVGTKAPNELGLYDMSGNVYEWCNDYFDNYSSGSQTNPQGPSSGSSRSLRGGSWNLYQGCCRVSFRGHTSPSNKNRSIGFRLVLSQ